METVTPPPLTLTVDILVKCGVAKSAAPKFIDVINELLPFYGITTHLRIAHFIAQVVHESGGLKYLREIASGAAYEGRLDLGNTEPGDGILYAGRGAFQTTGRSNYTAFAKKFKIDCVNHPELLEEPRWALASALYYWQTRNLSYWADKDNVDKISRLINGGTNGLVHRKALLIRCKAALAPLFATI